MKVLFLANSAYIPDDNRKTVTGYDYIVAEIAQKLSDKCDIDLYLLRPYPRSLKVGSVNVIGHTDKEMLKYLRIGDTVKYYKLASLGKLGIKSKVRNIFHYLVMRDIERLIKKNGYDIVHVHGVEFMDVIASVAAAKCQVPFLYTMHGLMSYGIPNIKQIDKDSEQGVLNMVRDNDFVITTVSTGTKMVPCEDKGINPDKVVVINNALKMDIPHDATDWKAKYPQIIGKKVILSVGSVSSGKNQIQLLRAFSLLPDEIKSKSMIFLAGQDLTGGMVADYVMNNHLEDNVVICGFLSRKELAGLYQIADYNALLSISEGFGLSMIEAAKYGVPSLTFSDLDAIKDLDPESMCLLQERTDEAVANGLMRMFATEWNKKSICKSVERFNDEIYFKYLDVYNQIIDNKSNIVEPKVVLYAVGL